MKEVDQQIKRTERHRMIARAAFRRSLFSSGVKRGEGERWMDGDGWVRDDEDDLELQIDSFFFFNSNAF